MLNLALFHRCKYQCDCCFGYDCGYTDKHQEGTDGAQCTKSADKGTVILSLNSAGDKTSVCCMGLQAVVLTPIISWKQNCMFITLRSTTTPQRPFRLHVSIIIMKIIYIAPNPLKGSRRFTKAVTATLHHKSSTIKYKHILFSYILLNQMYQWKRNSNTKMGLEKAG